MDQDWVWSGLVQPLKDPILSDLIGYQTRPDPIRSDSVGGPISIIWNPMEVIKNSKETFVRLQQLIWNGGTDTQTDRQTDRQTDPCIELRYAQLIIRSNM